METMRKQHTGLDCRLFPPKAVKGINVLCMYVGRNHSVCVHAQY